MLLRTTLCLVLSVLFTHRSAAIDFSPVTAAIDELVSRPFRTEPAGLLIKHFDGTVLLDQTWGDFDHQTVMPIASATKWLSGVAIMSLADDGLLDLDRPVDEMLPEFVGHPAGSMTVRQMFSHTAGAPGGSDWVNNRTITLAESVAGIAANETWQAPPGEEFFYGGVSMQVAGRVAEVLDGRPWGQLFNARVLQPLGISDTDFQGLGPSINPRIAGGAQTSLGSYERVLRMLIDGGDFEGQRVLSEAAVATMLSDQTAGATLVEAPTAIEDYLGYGIGNWVFREGAEGQPVEFSSPGAFGATPWIDFENQYYGVFLIEDSNQRVAPLVDEVRAFTREALSLAGDYNLDGVVDAGDRADWLAAYGTVGFSRADGNGDGRVDTADYTLWRDAFAGGATAVPEPSAAALLAAVLLGLLDLKPHRF